MVNTETTGIQTETAVPTQMTATDAAAILSQEIHAHVELTPPTDIHMEIIPAAAILHPDLSVPETGIT